jgi:hypothetical protein
VGGTAVFLDTTTVQTNGGSNVVDGNNVFDLIFADVNGNVRKTRDQLKGILRNDVIVDI